LNAVAAEWLFLAILSFDHSSLELES